MSKYTTRKSVAVVSALALGFAGLSAPAAFAAGTIDGKVTLAPSAGTTYTMLTNEKFDLAANFSTAADNGTNLKFYVTDADSISRFDVVNSDSLATADTPASSVDETGLTGWSAGDAVGDVVITNDGTNSSVSILLTTNSIEVGDAVTLTNTAYDDGVVATPLTFDGTHEVTARSSTGITFKVLGVVLPALDASTSSTNFDFDLVEATEQDALDSADELRAATFGAVGATGAIAEKTTAAAGRNADGSYIVDTADTDDAGVDSTLRLVVTEAGSVSVQAWIDSDDDNVIDDAEYSSPLRTVTFVDAADVTVTTTMDAPLVGNTGTDVLQAYITISNDVNLAQFASGDFKVDFKADTVNVSGGVNIAAAYDSTLKVLKSGAITSYTILAGTTYSAQAEYALANIGAIAYSSTDTGSSDIGASGDTSNAGVSTPAVATSTTWNGTNVKSGTTSVQLVSDVTTYVASGTAPAAPAGVKAKVTLTKVALDSTTTITAGGVSLTSAGTSVSYFTTTNADGEVVVDLVSSTGKKTDSVTVGVQVLDSDTGSGASGYTTAVTKTLTWADATVASSSAVVNLDAVGASATLNVAKNASLSIRYMVRDSFGAPLTATGYRLAVTSSSATGGGSVSTSAAVVGGYATVTFTDNTVSTTGNYTVDVDLEKLNVAGTAYATVVSGADVSTVVYVHSTAVATVTTTTAMLSSATKKNLEEVKAVIAGDGRGVGITFPYTGQNFQITGKAKASTGAGVAGVPVTITADSALVGLTTATSGTTVVYGKGSITVMTQADGTYNVYAYSNKAGAVNFTVTSGSATASTGAYYTAASQDKGTVLTVDAPAVATPGQTLRITGSLTDKFGNGVTVDGTNEAFRLVYTGPGYYGTAPSTIVAADGSFAFNVLLGSNDVGTATVVASYDQNDSTASADYADALDLNVSKTIVIGGSADLVASWTKNLNDGTVKMYAKNIVGAGKVQFMLNGEEIAWVRATSAADSKLRTANGASYLVRTVDLVEGQKNVLEIYVDGVRTARTAYTY